MKRYEVARRRVSIEDYGRPLAWPTIRPYLILRFSQRIIKQVPVFLSLPTVQHFHETATCDVRSSLPEV